MYNKADWRNNRTEKGFCMKEIRTEDAVGHILCHDITQIIKDEKKGVLFKKGHVVKEDDIPLLLSVGKEHLFVWEKKKESFMKMRRQKLFTESVRAIP